MAQSFMALATTFATSRDSGLPRSTVSRSALHVSLGRRSFMVRSLNTLDPKTCVRFVSILDETFTVLDPFVPTARLSSVVAMFLLLCELPYDCFSMGWRSGTSSFRNKLPFQYPTVNKDYA